MGLIRHERTRTPELGYHFLFLQRLDFVIGYFKGTSGNRAIETGKVTLTKSVEGPGRCMRHDKIYKRLP